MAQIVVGITIAGEESYSIGLELIKRISNFLQSCVGVKDIRKRSKEAVVLRVLVPQSLAKLVAFSGKTGRLSSFEYTSARSSNG